jgi:hypothetical protein
MPVKITLERDSVEDRIGALRLTIKNGEGLTMKEVSVAVGRSLNQTKRICLDRNWVVKQFCVESRNYLNLLVNPKTLALCRKK